LVITIYYKFLVNDNQFIKSSIKIDSSFIDSFFSHGEKMNLVSEIFLWSSIVSFVATAVFSILKYFQKK
jgi:hypothetical protein